MSSEEVGMGAHTVRGPGRPGRGGPAAPDEDTVLQRGLEAFAELGYDGASARELARRLGVSHNFINDRYGSKAAFWRAVVDRVLAAQKDRLTALVEQHTGDDEAVLRAVIGHFYRSVVDTPMLGRVLTDEFRREGERLDHLHRDYIAPVLAAVMPSVERLAAQGRIRPLPTDLLYFAVIGPATGFTQFPLADRLAGRGGRTPRERRDDAGRLAEAVLDGLIDRVPPARG
ncbi:TetR/AcrR family transcriptional regulator [Nocardiopsis sp. NPDC006139]|uniref:TetR/AcrR family transcriptional regulator n=1 Tax=Nocardiopsis TaxID=2013 RepID=UPI0033B04595